MFILIEKSKRNNKMDVFYIDILIIFSKNKTKDDISFN